MRPTRRRPTPTGRPTGPLGAVARRRPAPLPPGRRPCAPSSSAPAEPIDLVGTAGRDDGQAHPAPDRPRHHHVLPAAPASPAPTLRLSAIERAARRRTVRALLGREPKGGFEVAARDADGDPIVIRNAPLLDDGTPMPTRYWLVGRRRGRRRQPAGGRRRGRRAEAEIGVEVDRRTPTGATPPSATPPCRPATTGPRPTGGVGGTRRGVKCLHAHYAWYLAGGDDPVGAGSPITSPTTPDSTPGL